jgi:YesN/AraC family two-component response regulator
LLIFEYDYPLSEQLKVLQQTKATFPSLPILMLTKHHSEDLAIWAFRSGVRDYLHTPVYAKELAARVARLIQFKAVAARDKRTPMAPDEPLPALFRSKRKPPQIKTTPALDYIQANLHEKITLKEAALRCGISPYTFSHLFQKEHQVSFQEFLLRSRIRKAQELLNDTALPVKEIAYAVGFLDLPYFTRTFRRYMGMTPTDYRLLQETLGAVPMCLPSESMDTAQQATTKPSVPCRLCEDPSCACWNTVTPPRPKRIPAKK